MKLLFKLLLSMLGVVLMMAIAYLLLPSFATELVRYQLKQQGFSEVQIQFGTIGLSTTDIERVQLSNDNYRIEINDLLADYNLAGLLSGEVKRIHIEALSIYSIGDGAQTQAGTLPSPELLSGFLSMSWHDFMPANALSIDRLSYYSEDGAQSLSASVAFSKLGQQVRGKISLANYRQKTFQAEFEISPETGIDIQMFSQKMRPLSIRLKPMPGVDGLSGTLQLDIAMLAEMFDLAEKPSGSLQADIKYFKKPDSPETHFSIIANGAQLALSDAKINAMQLRMEGRVAQHDNVYQIAFLPTSQFEFLDIQQGQNTLQRLQMGLPQSMYIADGNIKFVFDPETGIILSELNMAPFSTPQAQLDKLDLAFFSTADKAQICRFKMRLASPHINIDNQRIEPSPVLLEGRCPERNTRIWSIDAQSDKIDYQNPDYILSLDHCQLTVGNAEQGKRLDPDPAELGGTILCDTSQLSGAVKAQLRFNPQNSTGRADFSVSDIRPDDETPLFSSVLKDWSQPFELASGTLAIEGQYRWWQNSRGLNRENLLVNLDVIEAGGHYEGILFSGLNYNDSIEVLPTLRSSEVSTLSVDFIDVAVPLTRASANIRFSPTSSGDLPILEIDKLTLSLLDGKLTANDLEWDVNSDHQNLLFSVQDLDLAQIVEMQQLEGLAATGLLDGKVPVGVSPDGFSIRNGKINAQQAGGQIQYIPSGETGQAGNSVPGSDLVLRILENLYYDALSVDVDYAEDGQLTMELAIQGKSPQVDANRPIHFNLTLEQNLLTLLKGLRYAEGISDDIDQSVQKYYKEKENRLN